MEITKHQLHATVIFMILEIVFNEMRSITPIQQIFLHFSAHLGQLSLP